MATTNTPLSIPPHRRNAASSLNLTSSSNCGPPIDDDYIASLDFFGRYLYDSSVELRYLVRMKKNYKENPKIEARFAERRATCGQANPEMYLNIYDKAMREIDSRTGFSFVSNDHVKRFLDLGCAPGGFSRWISNNNPSCTGMGVTLPTELGGFKMEFSSPGRYKYFYRDITENPELIYCQNEDDRTIGPQFDLCIAGCTYRCLEMDTDNFDSPDLRSNSRHHLLYSQVSTALTNLQESGTLILVFNLGAHISKIEIICSLSCCFERLIPVKPKSVYAIRSCYYLVGVNYKPEEAQKLNLLERLRTAAFRTESTNLDFQNSSLLEGSSDQILTKWGAFVLQHYQAMWEAQARAIEEDLCYVKKATNNRY